MNTISPTLEEITEAIVELPEGTWPELASYVEFLQWKTKTEETDDKELKRMTGKEFLLSIAGMASFDEPDLSIRHEEILMAEIDPIRGWTLNPSEAE